jgi:hypothetical protein
MKYYCGEPYSQLRVVQSDSSSTKQAIAALSSDFSASPTPPLQQRLYPRTFDVLRYVAGGIFAVSSCSEFGGAVKLINKIYNAISETITWIRFTIGSRPVLNGKLGLLVVPELYLESHSATDPSLCDI